ncbi:MULTISPECIES: mercuric transporter MerT family protein [Enterobacteriaceae]|nr:MULTISPECIES: mercuric transporter MerT family protein [Enterobacteriaceae]MDL0059964.1 mercuric transporter MerT family protein [Enterobacter roggenkampii]GCZ39228.1 mercury transport protein MerC [Escherichia coli]HDX3968855.1 MerC family mercury resistance protein [Enterobacter asburiae]
MSEPQKSEPQKSEPQKSEPQNGRGALFAGGLAAILASACCLGPLVLIALGFSGAWIGNLTVLEPYRPIFISQYEGLFIGILLPMFAGIALLANAIAWLNHRQWRRTALGTIGPILVLAAVFLMRAYGWQSGGLLYVGLALMVGVSVWDFISPAHRRCGPDSCELPEQRG